MRVTIEHQPHNKGYFVTTSVLFTEEEKSIIEARRLGETILTKPGASAPPVTTGDFFASWAFGALSTSLFFIGLAWMFLGFLVKNEKYVNTTIPSIMMTVSVPLLLYALYRQLRIKFRTFKQDTAYNVQSLFRGPIKLYAATPFEAKIVDDEVRENLRKLKVYIDENRDVRRKESFEL